MEARLQVPGWQIALVLAFPALYLASAGLPWAQALGGTRDGAFYAFWGSVLALHAASALAVLALLRADGLTRESIGLPASLVPIAACSGLLLAVGLAAVGFRELVTYPATEMLGPASAYPSDRNQRLFWVLLSLAAGFCEEIVYRGFLLRALRGKGLPVIASVGISSVAFALAHGVASWQSFAASFALGVVLAGLFLGFGRLLPVIALHACIELVHIVEVEALGRS